jgi:hypothetical protein
MTQHREAVICEGLEVGFELDLDKAHRLPPAELRKLREMLPTDRLPPPLSELRRRLDRCCDAAGAARPVL